MTRRSGGEVVQPRSHGTLNPRRTLTGRKSLWEAQGLKSFFHSAAWSPAKLMGYRV